jgi:lysozyme
MEISEKGLSLIKQFEGLRLEAYMPTPIDVPTIGYGHTKTAVMGMKITKKGADMLLKHDIRWVEVAVNHYVQVPLNQNQYDALCSWTYNLGETNLRRSSLLKELNDGNYVGAGIELLRWNKQGGKPLKGLTRRREAELELFEALGSPTTSAVPTRTVRGLSGALRAILGKLTRKDK